jgi:hypothetical protein
MGSLYLHGLSAEARSALEKQLWQQQNGNCFISSKPMDLTFDELDIDHIIPTRDNGKDDPSNFALTLATYNRSKQAADLRVARVLARFDQIKETSVSDDRGANLNDVLSAYGGSTNSLRGKIDGTEVTYIDERNSKVTVPVHTDKLSGMRYFFAVLPISTIYHDERINPRPIGANVRGLIEEFFKRRPQLHIALGWIASEALPEARVNIFDGQHKAAAQILLGVSTLPVRVFIDPDFDVLMTTNTNAGTTLRQVAFDKSVQRRLGSAMLLDRITLFRKEKNLPDDDESFSEKSLVDYFRGDQRAVGRYVLDGIRNSITHSPDNKLRDYIDYAGKGHEKPFSYSTIEKTFYSKFIGAKMLETPWHYKAEQGENPRTIEVEQISRLMSLIAENLYVGKYDEEIGTAKLENKVQKGDDVPEAHLRAFRMAKEEILYCWIGYIGKIIENHFWINGAIVDSDKIFQYRFPEQLWINIGIFIRNLAGLPMWVNRDASLTLFGGKQNYAFWQTIFASGSSPSGHKVMPTGLNIMDMIKP